MPPPRLDVDKLELGRGEESRVDGVEVAASPLEHGQKGLAKSGRAATHRPRADLREAVVVAGHLQPHAAAVEDGVVRAADGHEVVGRHRRQRRRAGAAADPAQVEAAVVQFMKRRFERAGHHLKRARPARGAGHEQDEPLGGHSRSRCEVVADLGRWQRARLEKADRHGRRLPQTDRVKEFFPADRCPDRPAGHGEVAAARNLPAGVLGGQAGGDRMVARDRHRRPRAAGPGGGPSSVRGAGRRDGHVAGSPEGNPRHAQTGLVAAGRVHAAVQNHHATTDCHGRAELGAAANKALGDREARVIETHAASSKRGHNALVFSRRQRDPLPPPSWMDSSPIGDPPWPA